MARTTAFNPDEKLQQAMMLFWERGYEATSMQDIVDTLAINRFSVYNTFGDKRALYAQSLSLYMDTCFRPFMQALQPHTDGMDAIKRYIKQMEKFLCSDAGAQGCLMSNNMSEPEFRGSEITAKAISAFGELHLELVKVLVSAKEQGRFGRQTDPKACGEYIFTYVQGLSMVRKTLGRKAVKRNVRFFLAELDAW